MRFAFAALLAFVFWIPAPVFAAAESPPGAVRGRTLKAVPIEGELAVPRVLFITAREPARPRDRLTRLFQPSARELARRLLRPAPIQIHTGLAREAVRTSRTKEE